MEKILFEILNLLHGIVQSPDPILVLELGLVLGV